MVHSNSDPGWSYWWRKHAAISKRTVKPSALRERLCLPALWFQVMKWRASGFEIMFVRGSGFEYFILKKINTQSFDQYWFHFRPSLHDSKCLIKNESSGVLAFHIDKSKTEKTQMTVCKLILGWERKEGRNLLPLVPINMFFEHMFKKMFFKHFRDISIFWICTLSV